MAKDSTQPEVSLRLPCYERLEKGFHPTPKTEVKRREMKLRNKHSNGAGDPCEADRQPEIPKGKNGPHQYGRTVFRLPPIVRHRLGQKRTKVCARVARIG